jgi:hypothetical protein
MRSRSETVVGIAMRDSEPYQAAPPPYRQLPFNALSSKNLKRLLVVQNNIRIFTITLVALKGTISN